jgi:hypothetical protein
MSKTERKRIIDYIFRHPDTPEDIRQQFERWMLAREHDSGIDEILWDIWENHAAPVSEGDSNGSGHRSAQAGSARFHAASCAMQAWPPPSCWYSSEAISPPRRRSHPKRRSRC